MEHKLNKEWFDEWFGSPYYHILYRNRDENEARNFLNHLFELLNFDKSQRILDLACGKGRHAIYLNQRGYTVSGIDLAEDSIRYARKFENEDLKFFIHDMREPFQNNQFDLVLNMFTSFGYFETREENLNVVRNVYTSLVEGGVFLLDFLNPYTAINHLQPEEKKEINGIQFHISKRLKEGFIQKDIKFTDQGKPYHFVERVKAIPRTEFLEYFKETDFEVNDIFGSYALDAYQKETSERMIFLLRKRT